MKRISLLASVACLVLAGPVHANQSNTGCGIGTMIFEGKDGLLSQLGAVTTNGIFGNQTFGITSGTLNCAQFPALVANEQIERFVGDNMDHLAIDISRGEGEYISTLAVLLDIPVSERAAFYTKLQSNFATLYPNDAVTHFDMLSNLEIVLQS